MLIDLCKGVVISNEECQYGHKVVYYLYELKLIKLNLDDTYRLTLKGRGITKGLLTLTTEDLETARDIFIEKLGGV